MLENWRKSKICIVINDKSQGSIAKHLRCDELFYYTFIIQSAGERILKLVNIWQRPTKWLIVSCSPFTLHFCPQRWLISPDKLKLCIMDRTVTNCCCVNKQIHVSLLSTNIKLL